MTMEAVNDSLIKAVEFYRNYFRMDIKAFICSSWLLNSYWRRALPESNMAKLQRAFRLGAELRYPFTQGKFFVYGDEGCDPRKMPCTTSLHRAFCKAADDGEYLTAGTIIVTAKDIENLKLK